MDAFLTRLANIDANVGMDSLDGSRALRVFVVGTSTRTWKVAEPLQTAGADIEQYRFTGRESIRPFARRVGEFDPDVIITDSIGWVGAITLIIAARHRIPYAVRLRGDAMAEHAIWLREHATSKAPGALVKELVKTGCTVASLLGSHTTLSVSEFLRDRSQCRRLVGDSDPIVRTPVDIPADTQTEDEQKTVLAVSNFVFPEKALGLADTIDSIATVLDERPEWTLRIAGDGPYRERLAEEVSDESSIKLLGYVDDIDTEYRRADVFIHFSYLDAYPSTVLEAGSHALPAIVNSAGGMPEQVTDGETGFVVSLDEPSVVAERLGRLLDDRALRRQFGTAHRNAVMETNTRQTVGEQFRASLGRVLSE